MDISIVVPIYNCEDIVEETLSSIVNQKAVDNLSIEVILWDDGSKDATLEVVKKFIQEVPESRIDWCVYSSEVNHGQGYTRNRCFEVMRGETVLCLDSDDLLADNAVRTVWENYLFHGKPDMVQFEWGYYYPNNEELKYVETSNPRIDKEVLSGAECDTILNNQTFFSVNKLYKKAFLERENIRYGEGYIYEDFEFFVQTINRSSKVVCLPNLLYFVRVHGQSTTKTNHHTRLHYDSFLTATSRSLALLEPRDNYSVYAVLRYFLDRSFKYRVRVPASCREGLVTHVQELIVKYQDQLTIPENESKTFKSLFQKTLKYQGKKGILVDYYFLKKTSPYIRKLRQVYQVLTTPGLVRRLRKIKNRGIAKYKPLPNSYKNSLLMLGFDFQMAGNSKYFYEYVKENHPEITVYVATTSTAVSSEDRVAPYSADFYQVLRGAKIVMAESWVPFDIPKQQNQQWIQLWHGTPLKKMLFDSFEPGVVKHAPRHKQNKLRDIQRWDYLVVDSDVAVDKFKSSMLVPEKKMLKFGYPRNGWLIEEANSQSKGQMVKKKVLYAPTWRDYNHRLTSDQQDFTYYLDIEKLADKLGSDFEIHIKDHDLVSGGKKDWSEQIIVHTDNKDSQEILAEMDLVISDYSSIIFDGMHIDMPFYLYVADFEKYSSSRGVYADIFREFEAITTNNVEELVTMIRETKRISLRADFQMYDGSPSEKLVTKIKEILLD